LAVLAMDEFGRAQITGSRPGGGNYHVYFAGASFSPCGTYLITFYGGDGSNPILWDCRDWTRFEERLPGRFQEFSADGGRLVVFGDKVHVIDLKGQRPSIELREDPAILGPVDVAHFSSDGTHLVTA